LKNQEPSDKKLSDKKGSAPAPNEKGGEKRTSSQQIASSLRRVEPAQNFTKEDIKEADLDAVAREFYPNASDYQQPKVKHSDKEKPKVAENAITKSKMQMRAKDADAPRTAPPTFAELVPAQQRKVVYGTKKRIAEIKLLLQEAQVVRLQ